MIYSLPIKTKGVSLWVRAVILFPVIFFFTSLSASADNSLEKVSIQLKWLHSFQFAGYYAAIEKGYFKEAGLDVELIEYDFSKSPIKSVLDGDADYGVSDHSLVLSHLKNDPVILVAQIFQRSALVYLSKSQSGILEPRDFIGKTLAYSEYSDHTVLLALISDVTKKSVDKIKRVPATPESVEDFIDDKIDIIPAYRTNEPFTIEQEGIKLNIISPQDYGYDFYGDNLFTSRKELLQNPLRVEKVRRAVLRGWEYALANPAELIQLLKDKYGAKDSDIKLRYEAREIRDHILPELVPLGSVDLDRLKRTALVYEELGYIDTHQVQPYFLYESEIGKPTAGKIQFSLTEKQWILDNPIVTYGAEKEWAPYQFLDKEGRQQGITRDFLDLIAKYSGLVFSPEYGALGELINKSKEGKIDLLPTLYYSKTRSEFLAYSSSYASDMPYFFVKKDVFGSKIEELFGKVIALPKGSLLVKEIGQNYPEIEILTVPEMQDAINAVLQGKADGLVDSYAAVSYNLNQSGITDIRAFTPLYAKSKNDIYMAVPLKHAPLASIITKVFEHSPQSEKQEIFQRWTGISTAQMSLQLKLTEADRKWLKENPVITFAGDPDWLPMEAFDDSGNFIGVVADYLKVIGRSLNVEFDVKQTQSWSETLERAEKGEFDVVSALVGSKKLPGHKFTQSYISSPIVIIMDDTQTYVDSLDQLYGKKIGIIKNYSYANAIKNLHPNLDYAEIRTVRDGLLALSTGEIDAFVCTLINASYQMTDLGLNHLRIVGKTEFSMRLGFAVSPKAAPLLPILNKALDSINPKEKKAILDSWGKANFASQTDYQLVMKVGGVLSLIAFVIWLWNLRLNKEIKQRKQSESELSELNQRHELAMDAVSFGVWELIFHPDKKQPELLFNQKMREIYNLAPDQEVTLDLWLSMIDESDRDTLESVIEGVKNEGGRYELEFNLCAEPDQPSRVIYCGMSNEAGIIHLAGSAVKIIGINWDISSIKQTERELESARQIADQANSAKSEFLANMSHEIRTPMNAILGFTELLDEQLEDQHLKSFIKTIRSAGKSLLSLINDILDLSKIEAGKLQIIKRPCDPYDLFEDIATIFMMRVREKNLDLILDVDDNIPQSLHLDDVRLRQILFNLIGNAVKFTEKGSITIKVRAKNAEPIKSTVDLMIEIIDTGIGISEEDQDKVFSAFVQSQKNVNHANGTGLGLSISMRLADLMGGEITLQSKLGHGSTFQLYLASVDVASMIADKAEEKVKFDYKDVVFSPAKILAVDDVTENRDLLINNFKDTPVEVFTAEDGLQAVEMAKQNNFDMIFMDIRMPIMDGYEAANLIKQFSDVPIVALTASVMTDEFEKINTNDFNGFLKKPVLRAELFKSVADYVEHEFRHHDVPKPEPKKLSSTEKQHAIALNTKLATLVEEANLLCENNNIGAITQFADNIDLIMIDRPISLLEEFVENLRAQLNSFDIVGIKLSLQSFESLLKEIEMLSIDT